MISRYDTLNNMLKADYPGAIKLAQEGNGRFGQVAQNIAGSRSFITEAVARLAKDFAPNGNPVAGLSQTSFNGLVQTAEPIVAATSNTAPKAASPAQVVSLRPGQKPGKPFNPTPGGMG